MSIYLPQEKVYLFIVKILSLLLLPATYLYLETFKNYKIIYKILLYSPRSFWNIQTISENFNFALSEIKFIVGISKVKNCMVLFLIHFKNFDAEDFASKVFYILINI